MPAHESLPLLGNRAAVFGHEVANALTVISSALQFVDTALQTDPDLNAIIRSALDEIDRLGALVHEFCSLGTGQTLNFEFADLARIVEEALALQIDLPGWRN